jgi:hypothetical protein
MIIKINKSSEEIKGSAVDWEMITGKIRTSSTSKIKNTIAIRKKRSERGRRGIDLGVNPHSKGLLFSRSSWNLVDSLTPTATKITPNRDTIVIIVIRLII